MELMNDIMGTSKHFDYQLSRQDMQPLFTAFLEHAGFDSYGYMEPNGPAADANESNNGKRFICDKFALAPYDWDEDFDTNINFEYFPAAIKICWYKYPLRDAVCNRDITPAELAVILEDCLDYLGFDCDDAAYKNSMVPAALDTIVGDVGISLWADEAYDLEVEERLTTAATWMADIYDETARFPEYKRSTMLKRALQPLTNKIKEIGHVTD